MRLDGVDEQAITYPLPHDELVQLQRGAKEARVAVDPLPGNACQQTVRGGARCIWPWTRPRRTFGQ